MLDHRFLSIGLAIAVVPWFLFLIRRRKRTSFPDGPKGYPILGSLDFLRGMREPEHLTLLSKKYGDTFEVSILGMPPIVCSSSYNVAKEALVDHSSRFSDRMSIGNEAKFKFQKGILFSKGDSAWRSRRRVISAAMRRLGVGKTAITQRIEDEAQAMVSEYRKRSGEVIDVFNYIEGAIVNIIGSLCFSDRYELNDPEFVALVKDLATFRGDFGVVGTICMVLKLPYWFMIRVVSKSDVELLQTFDKVWGFIERKVVIISKERELFENLVTELCQAADEDDKLFKDESIVRCVFDMYLAGMDTTLASFYSVIRDLALYPEWQKKLAVELDARVGRDRLPTHDDVSALPLLHAIVYESLRVCLVASSIPRVNTANDTLIDEKTVPKGTILWINMHGILNNGDVFLEPGVFNPGRFLRTDGSLYLPEQLRMFGMGARSCIGERLALQELYIFTAALVHQFNLVAPADKSLLDTGYHAWLVRKPNPYKVILQSR